ncbi:MAG: bifunctional 2-polyprenyl-6-hydroxyphenol methylase/3-demethylubiquinol 3-O-methyltransferase UbiG, partial [Alphaproteobacteria bacterium]|nr:bifunctional 2-polyprenyl-6-hydroxyphenol methylase/3-demethylubiquinol 3-O-methyltransferase UbiG [Alphaproteobacteria bacterium]
AIEVAREHAAQSGLSIDYKNGLIEETDALYDVVLALEIIEHVDDPAKFVRQCARVVKPGGIVIFSTLNRTAKSFALGIVAAEYILRWVPRGTHQWKRFLRPSQLARMCTDSGLSPRDITGLAFHPLSGEFALSETDMGVNYFLSGTKRTAESGE